jgi:hypothetical protein
MLAQIERISEIAQLENVTVGIVPFLSRLPIPIIHPVQIFDESTTMIELANTSLFAHGSSDVRFYSELFEAYFGVAVTEIDAILERAAKQVARLWGIGTP